MKFISVGVVLAIVQLTGLTMNVDVCEALQLAPAASGAWTWYKSMLITKPLITKSLTSSCIMSISDVMCQEVVAKSKAKTNMNANPDEDKRQQQQHQSSSKLDTRRVLDVAIVGAIWSGPVTHYWYIILEKMYGVIAKAANIQRPEIGLIVKLILDSIIFSSVTITGYFTIRSILEGTGLTGAKEKLTTRFFATLFGAWRFWPMANAVNFWFVPMQFRVLYMNVVSLFWTGWLTYVNSKNIPLPKRE